MFFETSAKNGINVKTMFNELAKKLTGIETDPISNSNNTAPVAQDPGAAGNNGFKLGGPDS